MEIVRAQVVSISVPCVYLHVINHTKAICYTANKSRCLSVLMSASKHNRTDEV